MSPGEGVHVRIILVIFDFLNSYFRYTPILSPTCPIPLYIPIPALPFVECSLAACAYQDGVPGAAREVQSDSPTL